MKRRHEPHDKGQPPLRTGPCRIMRQSRSIVSISDQPNTVSTVCLDSRVTRLISATPRPACLIWAIADRTSGVVFGRSPTCRPDLVL
jgi:hypothetical protein